jgi:hypothetical protein
MICAAGAPLAFADAHDFRALNFGDSCNNVEELESQLGSSPQSKSAGIFIFAATRYDEDVSIIYICEGGVFSNGAYLFTFSKFSEAREFFEKVKPTLVQEYGKPVLDGSSDRYRRYIESLGKDFTEKDKYLLYWKLGSKNVAFSASKVSAHDYKGYVGVRYSPNDLQ